MAESSTTASPHTTRLTNALYEAPRYQQQELSSFRDDPPVRYVEVEQIEWREKRVPKKEYVEVLKEVKVPQYVQVERPVEVTEYHDVVREVPVDRVQEVVRDVERVEVVDVPVEQVRTVPRVQRVQREEFRQVPGEIIPVARPYRVEEKIPIPNYVDRDQPVVVAQKAIPTIKMGAVTTPILARDYDPVLCKVLIHVPKPVPAQLNLAGPPLTKHTYLGRIPATQWNQLLRSVNPHLSDKHLRNLWTADSNSRGIPPASEVVPVIVPQGPIEGHPPPRPLPAWPSERQVEHPRGGSYYRDELPDYLPINMGGTGRDRSAERHYRLHHSYFRHPSPGRHYEPSPQPAMSYRHPREEARVYPREDSREYPREDGRYPRHTMQRLRPAEEFRHRDDSLGRYEDQPRAQPFYRRRNDDSYSAIPPEDDYYHRMESPSRPRRFDSPIKAHSSRHHRPLSQIVDDWGRRHGSPRRRLHRSRA